MGEVGYWTDLSDGALVIFHREPPAGLRESWIPARPDHLSAEDWDRYYRCQAAALRRLHVPIH